MLDRRNSFELAHSNRQKRIFEYKSWTLELYPKAEKVGKLFKRKSFFDMRPSADSVKNWIVELDFHSLHTQNPLAFIFHRKQISLTDSNWFAEQRASFSTWSCRSVLSWKNFFYDFQAQSRLPASETPVGRHCGRLAYRPVGHQFSFSGDSGWNSFDTITVYSVSTTHYSH